MSDNDISRSLVISGLPSALLRDTADDFAETIYELLETTFNVRRDAVIRLIRSPRLEASQDQEEFGCKCLISFRSRLDYHSVIVQKSKLESPTSISSITKIPWDITRSNEELSKVTDMWTKDDEMRASFFENIL
ncbi:unnamed protein product [Cercopithifilaria johnstoni]|uniref:Uncharacterized protein n=1 Tax=Cercopithifilaria johnstoni TaxID=2874296 RepID=A0A8J2LV36_9BILA|nr:unnamed protein product [Cercopithifilaria johnstoni]